MWSFSLTKLCFFLVILPFFLTILHLQSISQRSDFLIVKGSNDLDRHDARRIYNGLYKRTSPVLFKRVKEGFSYWTSIGSMDLIEENIDSDTANVRRSTEHRWCVNRVYCSSTTGETPPSGDWPHANSTNTTSLYVQHLGIPTNRPMKQRNRNLEFLVTRPSTSILLVVNVGLAFIYWNYRIDPSSVAKVYSKIVFEHEYGRAFSGATAHFEPIHLAFNCMALYNLGGELEGLIGSVPFLFYNISLIPITTVLMMLMVKWQIKRTGNNNLSETSTVGYSGVLFAWMVVSSLERESTCPIPLFDDVCFHTYSLMGVRINIGPIIQLFIAQMILQRVSFVGHLSGIVAGFLLHWIRKLNPLFLIQPAVLIPAIHIILLYKMQKLIPSDSNRRSSMLWNSMVFLLLMTVLLAAYLDKGMIIMLLLQAILFYFSSGNSTISKGFVFSAILTTVTDSMTLAGWCVFHYMNTNAALGLSGVVSLMSLRLLWQILAICFVSKELSDDSSIFSKVFGPTIVNSGATVGHRLFDKENRGSLPFKICSS